MDHPRGTRRADTCPYGGRSSGGAGLKKENVAGKGGRESPEKGTASDGSRGGGGDGSGSGGGSDRGACRGIGRQVGPADKALEEAFHHAI